MGGVYSNNVTQIYYFNAKRYSDPSIDALNAQTP